MNEFVAVPSTNIAKIRNIHPRKVAIVVRADADIVVFYPKASKIIHAATQKSIIDYNVFKDWNVMGLPIRTRSGGSVLWGPNGGQPQSRHGQHIARPANPPISRAYSQLRDLIAPRAATRNPALMPIVV